MSEENYQTYPISPNWKIRAERFARGFTLSDYEKERIESLWSHETRLHPQTFNGQILNVISFNEEGMIGEFVDYKFYMVQRLDPNLKEILNIRTLAVSGVTQTADRFLIGQRSKEVSTYPEFYEFVPSGGVDPSAMLEDGTIDIYRQFKLELFEETTISVTDLKEIRLRGLIWDEVNYNFELCADLIVNYTVLKQESRPSQEYKRLFWMQKRELADFIDSHRKQFVPLSLYLAKKPRK